MDTSYYKTIPLTERGMKKRLKAIDKAIEKLTND